MISLDVLLDGITVTVEPPAAGHAEPDPPSVCAWGDTGILELVGGARVCCSPAEIVVLPSGMRRHPALARRGGDQGARVARNLIRATYRGSVGLFDTLREPLSQPLGGADQIRCSFEEMLDELLAPPPGARAMAEVLLRRWLILLFRRWWPAGAQRCWLAALGDHRLGRVITAMQERPQQAEALGHSPMEFLQTIRLDRAARLLTSTDLPVKGIARQVGYVSRSSFTRRPLAAADAWAPLPDRRTRAGFDTAFIGRMNPYIEGPTC